MAWTKAEVEIKPAWVGTGIKAGMRATKKRPAHLTITVSEREAKQLGWGNGDRAEVMIGEGEHHGLIRVRKNNSAGQVDVVARKGARGNWYLLQLGHQPAFVNRSEVTCWCQWNEVEDGWIEVVLPKWADETRPKRRESTPEPHPAASAPRPRTLPTNRPASVTANLMGDPPPGRREALEKMSRKEALDRVGKMKP